MDGKEEFLMMQENEQQVGASVPEQPVEQAEEQAREPKKNRSSFFAGLATGLAVATVLCVAVFLIWFRITSRDATTYASTDGADAGEDIINPEAIEKLRLLNETIDVYYYKDDEVDLQTRRDGMYEGLIASLGDPYADYYTVEDRNAQREQMSGVYYGIGAYVTMHQELL
ncbi:MAG: hypothetical protein IJP92_07210, partial [Lachnospiraceae bacterium]|nr:hypothetical protein [Lachnospiraceae bacterium]